MYQKGQIWEWSGRLVVVDAVWTYRNGNELRSVGKVRETDREGRMALITEDINFCKEKENLCFVGQIPEKDYYLAVTRHWNESAPDTQGYEVCPMDEATHVVFCSDGLEMAAGDGKSFTPCRVYPVKKEPESGDYWIVNDAGQVVVGFDLFIPCEYLKKKGEDRGKTDSVPKSKKEDPENVVPFPVCEDRRKR